MKGTPIRHFDARDLEAGEREPWLTRFKPHNRVEFARSSPERAARKRPRQHQPTSCLCFARFEAARRETLQSALFRDRFLRGGSTFPRAFRPSTGALNPPPLSFFPTIFRGESNKWPWRTTAYRRRNCGASWFVLQPRTGRPLQSTENQEPLGSGTMPRAVFEVSSTNFLRRANNTGAG